MAAARITLDPAYTVAEVDPRLYGSFVEHLGRCVYTGIVEPDHPKADAAGFRSDVADLVRDLDVPIVRYPGGNFVSGYRWEDGVGPVADRPARLDLAWRSVESNRFGTDEFVAWCALVGSAPMLAVNLGTRGVAAACALVEYCNHPGGSYWSDLRVRNGHREPHRVRTWCLGNEMDGPWQIGHKTALEYGRLAAETAKAMRLVDPGVELVACGSSHHRMPTFGAWEAEVLSHCYEYVDHVSLHAYYEERPGDRGSFLACAMDMDAMIEDVVSTVDHVRARGRHRKRLALSFDEWNVWYMSRRGTEPDWEQAPRLLEDVYSVVDAVVVGNLLISLLRHADRVRIGCLAQLVNVIAPIATEPGGPAWRQTTYHPFALTSRYGRGTVLRTLVDSPRYQTHWFGETPVLDAVAVRRAEPDEVTVFAVNRDQRESLPVRLDLRGFPALRRATHTVLADADPSAVNTAADPDRVVPRQGEPVPVTDGALELALPPLSWNMLRLGP
ncbi:MAG: alpha-L-arabinofuranosidase [Micromonosporaceae bacterium]